ncbi:jacalin-like lectin domain-containing protein [Artemisia annua]|uniref:Jacalin-like lectin domain-containing protein n=1 Tax=Artemisia annua TaxID=35608 RepID=A0A2U1N0Y1_ARTAN|nr:jacalin-like lectin domain-containing protein [Artemisia annua]
MVYGGPDEDIIREHGEMNPRYNHSHIPFALDEFLTRIHGYYLLNQHGYPERLLSLGIDTNKNSYGPFGEGFSDGPQQLERYSFDIGSNRFRGFHGAVHNHSLSAIGVYVKKYISNSKNIEKIPPDPMTQTTQAQAQASMVQTRSRSKLRMGTMNQT